jgi:hypothetical protein
LPTQKAQGHERTGTPVREPETHFSAHGGVWGFGDGRESVVLSRPGSRELGGWRRYREVTTASGRPNSPLGHAYLEPANDLSCASHAHWNFVPVEQRGHGLPLA